jgi:hypothetical protein
MIVTSHQLECIHINDMPAGVLHHIFEFLGPRDLCCVSIICKYWAALNKDAAANQVRLGLDTLRLSENDTCKKYRKMFGLAQLSVVLKVVG